MPLDLPGPTPISRCLRCHGTWVVMGKIDDVRAELDVDHPVLDERLLRPCCRVCGAGITSGQTWCDDGHDQGIACVSCGRTMEVVLLGDIILDVCLPCEAAWFDEGELGTTIRKYDTEIRAQVAASLDGGETPLLAVRGAFGVLKVVLRLFTSS